MAEMSKKRKLEFLEKSNDKYDDILIDILRLIENDSNTYLNIDNILKDINESIQKNSEGFINRCVECNEDMGRCNPRQLCGKTFCHKKDEN